MSVSEQLSIVKSNVAEACRRSGRQEESVRIIAVTKYGDVEIAKEARDAGCLDLGESRPQVLWEKAAAFSDSTPAPRWHLIGHLQRNKVRRTLHINPFIHTVDSERLLKAINEEASIQSRHCDVLIEVNISEDQRRSGVTLLETRQLIQKAITCQHVRVRGLMGMASCPTGNDPSGQARRQFSALRELRDSLHNEMKVDDRMELSMGMSSDYVEAILEGATMIRIGTALFKE
ncbi:MAG: YggS family pyridoxal phosphate-dependent enzyme [Pirellulales bacterium]